MRLPVAPPCSHSPPPFLTISRSNLSCNPEPANKMMIKGRDGACLEPGVKVGGTAGCSWGAGEGGSCEGQGAAPSPHPWSAKPSNMQNLILFLGSRGL